MADTTIIQKRYNRNAKFYDIMESFTKNRLSPKWRKRYFSPLKGKILEIGIGTGTNIKYLNKEAEVIGIDFSEKMLEKARQKLTRSGKKNITLRQMDVENLSFKDNYFDYIITCSVFCSVPHPVKGLKEIKRVLGPAGKLIMIEHVLSKEKFIAFLQNLFNPLFNFFTGVNINRDTGENIRKSGMEMTKEQNLAFIDIFRLFIIKKTK